MNRAPTELDSTYRARAVPPGSVRYFSWLFATDAMREPLLGVYALTAEWHALLDPGTEREVACLKLAWWQAEITRLTTGTAVHPISRYLNAQSLQPAHDFAPLAAAVTAALLEASGVPLEARHDLVPHAVALYGVLWEVAARLGAPGIEDGQLTAAITALAEADYLRRALAGYPRAARAGRIVFPVDELLAAGVDNAALAAAVPSPPLGAYLTLLDARARTAARLGRANLPSSLRRSQRHLLVLSELLARGAVRQLVRPRFAVGDMLRAWNAARRA